MTFDDGAGDSFLDTPFSWDEFEFALVNLRLTSAPGLDGIDYRVITELPREVQELMLILFNEIYTGGNFLAEWKRYAVFFIKKGDGERVRSISLAACLLKLLERLVNNRLVWWLEHFNLFPPTKFGFRKSKSCIDSLAQFNLDIRMAIEDGKQVAALFLDIRSAYDNVLLDILLQRLKEMGIPSSMRKFIYSMVAERVIHCRFG